MYYPAELRQRRGPQGFTLIELLVVVAIIALLVAILVPALEEARAHAHAAVCMSNQHQLSLACMMYYESYKMMPAWVWVGPEVRMPFHGVEAWAYSADVRPDLGLVWPFYAEERSSYCHDWEEDEALAYTKELWPGTEKGLSYAFNIRVQFHFSSFEPGGGMGTMSNIDGGSVGPEGFRNPSSTLHFMDSASGYVAPWLAPPYWAEIYSSWPDAPGASWWETYHPSQRHMGDFNAAFLDGHVARCDFDKYYDLGAVSSSKSVEYWGIYTD